MNPKNNMKPLLYDFSLAELKTLLASWGEPSYRARQIWQGLYQQLWNTPQQFSHLPTALRNRLDEEFRFSTLNPQQELFSDDRETVKVLFRLPDNFAIETVLMRYERRRTLCVSTQSGCAMGCVFCATGQMGYKRNLSSGEIVEQVLYFARRLQQQGERVTNVVLMGMGEPFHNYQATMEAIDRLNDPEGFNFGERRFTVSTVGLIPMIQKFADEQRQVNLAVSLHAVNDDLRSSLLPINRKYPIEDLLAACRQYVQKTGRRITFEWALIKDVNDSPQDAHQLGGLLQGMLCHINVIPLNPTFQYAGQATSQQRARAFCEELEKSGIPCTIRLRRGIEIQAGCGQLAIQAKA